MTLFSTLASAQPPAAASIVPMLVNFSGTLTNVNGEPSTEVNGVTFSLYKDSEDGTPLWLENQNVQPDKSGHYTVILGSTTSQGLPSNLFASGEARWLGVRVQGQEEQPRVLLLSVPYAIKAGDSQTLGGLPASAFVLAVATVAPASGVSTNSSNSASAAPGSSAVTGTGKVSFIPLWDSTSDIISSVLSQSGSGSSAKVGINTNSPNTTLDVKGTGTIRGLLTLPATGRATAITGANSQALNLAASSFNSSRNADINQNFRWQAEPAGNNTTTPSGTLNLLFGSGSSTPAETGLHIGRNGQITFANGQTFPGTGTITGVTAGTDLTGGGKSGNVTLNLDTTKVPLLTANNTFTGVQTITSNAASTPLNVTQNASGQNQTYAITGTTFGTGNRSAGVLGASMASSGIGFGVEGYLADGRGAGVFGLDGNPLSQTGGTLSGGFRSGVNFGMGVWGDGSSDGWGMVGTADFNSAIVGTNNSSFESTVVVQNLSSSGSEAILGFNNSGTSPTILVENQNTTNGNSSLAPAVDGISFGPTGMGVVGSGPVLSSNFQNSAGFNPVGVVGDSAATGGIGVWGSTDNGTSVFGSTGIGTGVYGQSHTSGTGVEGQSYSGTGVEGFSNVGTGVYGSTDNTDGLDQVFGVWGADLGTGFQDFAANAGVYGYSQAGVAVAGVSYSTYAAGGELVNNAGGPSLQAVGTGGNCEVTGDGDLVCDGNSSAAVPLPDKRWIRLYAVESPENWFEDFGSGQLVNGSAVISLEATFAQTVNTGADYRVFPVPNGDCKGLYVTEKSASGFVVRELGGGKSNVAFDYRIVARRKGYENIRMADVTEMQNRIVATAKRFAKQIPSRRPPVMKTSDSPRPTPLIQMPVQQRNVLPLRNYSPLVLPPVGPVSPSTKR